MLNQTYNEGLRGILDVDIHRDDKTIAWMKQGLNLDSNNVTSSQFTKDRMNYWFEDCRCLKNGIAEYVPPSGSPHEIRQMNKGVSFLAHFPVTDLHLVLEAYDDIIRKNRVVAWKEKIYHSFNKIKTRLTGLETRTITFSSLGGISFSSPDPWMLLDAKTIADGFEIFRHGLDLRMKMAYEEWKEPYVVLQRGFDLADSLPGDSNTVQLLILGCKHATEDLVEKLRKNPDLAPRVLMDMFRHGTNDADHSKWVSNQAAPYYLKLGDGQYESFQRVKQTRIFDYLQKES